MDLLNLLLTYPGERVNLPKYGIGIKNLLFEQEIDIAQVKLKIQDQIAIYIPSIKLQGISTNTSEDKHTILISLSYTYLLDGSSNSIQLNFN